jgi:hypothetical protein
VDLCIFILSKTMKNHRKFHWDEASWHQRKHKTFRKKDFAEFFSRKTSLGDPWVLGDRLVARISWWLLEYHAV